MNWHIGQEVVSITNYSPLVKNGDYTIKGLRSSFCSCHRVLIDVGFKSLPSLNGRYTEICSFCNARFNTTDATHWFSEKRFASLDFNISELTDILKEPIIQYENC